jgi:polar amino acid transport system substrate-binding protein
VTAAELCRRRGRISLVGAVPIELDRRLLYEKEIELTVSMSYGPGRYDRRYEELGLDYPLPFVRWTENRNLQAFLGLVASGAVCPQRLDAEVVAFADAERVYAELARGDRSSLSLVFEYARDASPERTARVSPPARRPAQEVLGVAMIGAGNYAKGVLLPALSRREGLRRVALIAATGGSARRSAERFAFEVCGTDPGEAIDDPRVGLVFVATRHDSHAALAEAALRAGKAVWLEKPVGLSLEEVDRVVAAARESSGQLVIGYNRRFSPHARAIREALAGRRGPLALHYSVAAGPTPSGTWITDPRVGGGRILGEVCHFVDLCTFLAAAAPVSVFARALSRDPEHDDSTVAVLGFADGSTATIEYLARTDPGLPKERIEVSADGLTARCENFRSTRISGRRTLRTWNQDKGQAAAVGAALDAVRRGAPSPFGCEEIAAVSQATFGILESCRSGRPVDLAPRAGLPETA